MSTTERRKQAQAELARGGPLAARTQARLDAGPSPLDCPGFLYIYSEPGLENGEWKIGKTTLDPPERRMLQSAGKNLKTYKLRVSWHVPWCGYVENMVHLELRDLRVYPAKVRSDGVGLEDGGSEWFCGDIAVMEARVRLVLRAVRVREAEAAGAGCGIPESCGFFRCCLPVKARQRGSRDDSTSRHRQLRPPVAA